MQEKNIFITGISGCVGHYLFDILSACPEYRLFLLVRNPQKIRFTYNNNPRVQLLKGDLKSINDYAVLLKKMDFTVHLATGWGGEKAHRINVNETFNLFRSLNPDRCEKVLYFSTSSILENDGSLSSEALHSGTDYIKSKYKAFSRLSELKIYDRITTFFPTVILGGDENHKYSHATQELQKVWKHLWILKYFKFDGSFQFIHADSIARIVKHILTHECTEKSLILGNSAITVDNCIQKLCAIAGKKRKLRLDITNFLEKFIPFFLRKRLSLWDLYSLKRRHFCYDAVNVRTFNIKPSFESLEECITQF